MDLKVEVGRNNDRVARPRAHAQQHTASNVQWFQVCIQWRKRVRLVRYSALVNYLSLFSQLWGHIPTQNSEERKLVQLCVSGFGGWSFYHHQLPQY
jgi:hypothetical protein